MSRTRLPPERESTTVKFIVGGRKGYLVIGHDGCGDPKEIFLHDVGRLGSTMAGVCDAWATMISILLQYGVPLEDLVARFLHANFAPAGQTNDPDVPQASSVVDYVVRYLAQNYLSDEQREAIGMQEVQEAQKSTLTSLPIVVEMLCKECSWLMVRSGEQWVCECGHTESV